MRWIAESEHAPTRPILRVRREVFGAYGNGRVRMDASDRRALRWCRWIAIAYVAAFAGGAGTGLFIRWRERVAAAELAEIQRMLEAAPIVVVGVEG